MKSQKRCLGCVTAFLLLVFAISVHGQSRQQRDQAKKFQSAGDKAYQEKNYRLAVDQYGEAANLVPTNATLHFFKGNAHYYLKEYDLAAKEFTLALNQGFKPVDVYRARYLVHFEQKNFDSAFLDLQAGLKLTPNDPNLLAAVGETHLERKSYPEAIASFQTALKSAKNNADIYYNLARVYLGMDSPKLQAEAAEAALTKGTRFPAEAYYLLGDAQHKLKNSAGAVDAYQKAVSAKPSLYEAYLNLAEVFRFENRFTDAISILKRGQLAFPSDGRLFMELSWYYSLVDRSNDAVEAGRAGVTLRPEDAAAHTNLCRAYNEVKKYDLAISSCNSALRLKPGDGETNFYLGRAYNLSGRSGEARFYAQAVVSLVEQTAKNPMAYDGWYLLGNAYFANNQRDKAIEAYLTCLSLSPKFAKARYNLGFIYAIKKNKAAATEQLELLRSIDARLSGLLKAEIDKM